MKKGKKSIAIILSFLIIICVMPVIFTSATATNNLRTYSNDFNVEGDLSKITNDFNLYYDTSNTTLNSLSNITSDPSEYMTFSNNRLERILSSTDLLPWNNGNFPYWCMAYYTYKNQTFKDFTLKVDAYMPVWGTNYNAITVGSMGKGLKSNGGFTLGFYNAGASKTDLTVYLGSAADVAVNFDDWYVHDCKGKAIYTHESENYNYQITLTVFGGQATVKINDKVVLSNIYVGYLDGYVSLVNGLVNSGSNLYYDNLQIDEILDDDINKSAGITYRVESMGEYTAVNLDLDSDITYIKSLSDLSFDNKAFKYLGTVIEPDNIKVNNGKKITQTNGCLNIPIYCASKGHIATLYFKSINDSGDFSSFQVENQKMSLLNNYSINETHNISVFGDYNNDKCLNILDLIKANKMNTDKENKITLVQKLLLGVYKTAEISPLLGKSALYVGDSIAYGAMDKLGLSWAGRIAERGMYYENRAVSGWAVTDAKTSGRAQIATQFNNALRTDYDFVMLEGGVNDVLINERESNHPISFGSITADGTQFDTTTICGAIEDLIVKAKNKFPNATIGYIINNDFGATSTDMISYVNAVKTACNKHNIVYFDLGKDKYVSDNFIASKHLADKLHPNAEGYEILSKSIGNWMETLIK